MDEQTFSLLEIFNEYLRDLGERRILLLPRRITKAMEETAALLEKHECEVKGK